MSTILATTPATSVHIVSSAAAVLARGGVVGTGDDRTSSALGNAGRSGMPILEKALRLSEEVYLPDLQILPGKVEFSYLPINCQSVLVLPLPGSGAVVMGTNQGKRVRT